MASRSRQLRASMSFTADLAPSAWRRYFPAIRPIEKARAMRDDGSLILLSSNASADFRCSILRLSELPSLSITWRMRFDPECSGALADA